MITYGMWESLVERVEHDHRITELLRELAVTNEAIENERPRLFTKHLNKPGTLQGLLSKKEQIVKRLQ